MARQSDAYLNTPAPHVDTASTNSGLTEIDLSTGSLFPEAERVDYLVTRMDYLKIARVYSGREGLFLAVEPDEPVEPLVEALRD